MCLDSLGMLLHMDTTTAPIELDDIDSADSRAADRADTVAAIRASLADLQREMHQLQLDLLVDDYEVQTGAMYALTDAAERLTGLRFRLELAL